MIIHVYGINHPDQIAAFDAMMIDQVGLDFSITPAGRKPSILPEHLDQYDDTSLRFVGIFKNKPLDDLLDIVQSYRLSAVRLAGNEPPEYCQRIQPHVELIKTISMDDQPLDTLLDAISRFDDVSDYFYFEQVHRAADSSQQQACPWSTLLEVSVEKPFYIGGTGLRAYDAPALHQFRHPDYYGICIPSDFGQLSSSGDTSLIFSFIKAIQQVVN